MSRRFCIFCGSSPGARPAYAAAAVALVRYLVRNEIGIVYGGGNSGLMGLVADTALAEGGEVTGVMPRGLVDREVAHRGLRHLHIVDSMHERKALMAELAEGFIALPGGFGTFEEFFEVVTWTQLGIQNKPCGLLNVEGYYDAMLAMIDHGVREQFIKPHSRPIVVSDDDPAALVIRMLAAKPPAGAAWLTMRQS